MSRFDWIPCLGYRTSVIFDFGECNQQPLLDPTAIDAIDVVGRVEVSQGLFIHRIVGPVFHTVVDGEQPAAYLEYGITPGLFEVEGGNTAQTIFGSGSDFASSGMDGERANGEHWHVRQRFVRPIFQEGGASPLTEVDIPWWTFVDIKPKRHLKALQVPVLWSIVPQVTFQNSGVGAGQTYARTHMLRMLVTRT